MRTMGGNKKYRALRLDHGNFSWGSESKFILSLVALAAHVLTRPCSLKLYFVMLGCTLVACN